MTDPSNAAAAAASTPPGAPAAGRAGQPRPRRRMPVWDNTRFVCIVLVVVGHAINKLTYDSDVALVLYLVIYAFHMPAFALISGYFSKSSSPTRTQMARLMTDIVVPYVIFEGLWVLFKFLIKGRIEPNITTPAWTLWFLLALGIFRLVLPYLALLRWPLLWALVISIGAGYLPNLGATFSLARTLGLLPFFTLGWWLHEHDIVERFGLLRRRPWWVPATAIALFVVAAAVAWVFVGSWREMHLTEWLPYDEDYASIGLSAWWAGGVRLALIAVALLLSAALFALMPRNTKWWTHFGQYTMYVYLLHSFVLYPFREAGLLQGLEPTWLWLPTVVIASVLIAFGLATKPVRRLFRPLVEPRPSWLFADATLARREGHRSDPTGSRRPPDAPHGPRVHADPRQNG
ncbi:acyltransferase family protein [Microbacterium deminutum]